MLSELTLVIALRQSLQAVSFSLERLALFCAFSKSGLIAMQRSFELSN